MRVLPHPQHRPRPGRSHRKPQCYGHGRRLVGRASRQQLMQPRPLDPAAQLRIQRREPESHQPGILRRRPVG